MMNRSNDNGQRLVPQHGCNNRQRAKVLSALGSSAPAGTRTRSVPQHARRATSGGNLNPRPEAQHSHIGTE